MKDEQWPGIEAFLVTSVDGGDDDDDSLLVFLFSVLGWISRIELNKAGRMDHDDELGKNFGKTRLLWATAQHQLQTVASFELLATFFEISC